MHFLEVSLLLHAIMNYIAAAWKTRKPTSNIKTRSILFNCERLNVMQMIPVFKKMGMPQIKIYGLVQHRDGREEFNYAEAKNQRISPTSLACS